MFRIDNHDDSGARAGVLATGHGKVQTPFFMPVATKGTVKTLTHEEVGNLGFDSVISNALVLYLRPGVETIEQSGGLHSFTGWKKTIFTDSGGFQILNPEFLKKADEKGVVFRSPIDNSRHTITPEKCIEIQNRMGSDVAMVLDMVIPFGASIEENSRAVNMTSDWARRCKEAHKNREQLLFAITQGGTFSKLRDRSTRELLEIDFDGYGIGGLSIGEPKEVMHQIIKEQNKVLPEDKPRYLMGVGSPVELLRAISMGVDVFDSTFPTRNARHNDAYTFKGEFNISRGKFKNDYSPIEAECNCFTCKNHSRAYVHHLLKNKEVTGQVLMTLHNLAFIKNLMTRSREAIVENRFSEFKNNTLRGMELGENKK